MDVVVYSWLWLDPTLTRVDFHAHDIRARIVRDCCFCVPESRIECEYASYSKKAIEHPDNNTRPYEDIPISCSEDRDVVIHTPQRRNTQHNMHNKKELIMRPPYPIKAKPKQTTHHYRSNLSVPKVILCPVPEEIVPATTLKNHNRVPQRMNNSLHRSHTRNPSVESIICPKAPAREPDENIVAHAEKPYQGKICKR